MNAVQCLENFLTLWVSCLQAFDCMLWPTHSRFNLFTEGCM